MTRSTPAARRPSSRIAARARLGSMMAIASPLSRMHPCSQLLGLRQAKAAPVRACCRKAETAFRTTAWSTPWNRSRSCVLARRRHEPVIGRMVRRRQDRASCVSFGRSVVSARHSVIRLLGRSGRRDISGEFPRDARLLRRVERAPRVSPHPSSWCWSGGDHPSRGPCNVVPSCSTPLRRRRGPALDQRVVVDRFALRLLVGELRLRGDVAVLLGLVEPELRALLLVELRTAFALHV